MYDAEQGVTLSHRVPLFPTGASFTARATRRTQVHRLRLKASSVSSVRKGVAMDHCFGCPLKRPAAAEGELEECDMADIRETEHEFFLDELYGVERIKTFNRFTAEKVDDPDRAEVAWR